MELERSKQGRYLMWVAIVLVLDLQIIYKYLPAYNKSFNTSMIVAGSVM